MEYPRNRRNEPTCFSCFGWIAEMRALVSLEILAAVVFCWTGSFGVVTDINLCKVQAGLNI